MVKLGGYQDAGITVTKANEREEAALASGFRSLGGGAMVSGGGMHFSKSCVS